MNILSVNSLRKIGREEDLFSSVTFGLNEGEKAAVIGRNGCGKSTLLSTIAGVLDADDGTVVINKEAGVSFLPQNPPFNPEESIRDHIFKANTPNLSVIKEYIELCGRLGETSFESAQESGGACNKGDVGSVRGAAASVQKRYEELSVIIDSKNLWTYEAQVASVLETLGISDLNQKMGTLSGGMVKKVCLAQVLVEDTKLLLLDEPTNHLDISTIVWLQNYLHDTDRTVLMVTHDRYFLDAVCNNIFELSRKSLKIYKGNYSDYLDKKQIEAEIEQNTERRIESVLRFERDWLRRGPCARGTKAKARIQRDEQLINREKIKAEKGFSFEVQGRRLGSKVLEVNGISKTYAERTTPVIQDFSYIFTKGQKIGVFGDNGSGKSTFLNVLTGTLPPDSGSVEKGENTVFGYYMQNPVFANLNQTVLEYITEAAEYITRNDGRQLSASLFLNEFGFEGKIQHSVLSALSGGERKRLFLVRLLITNPNFLVLDEPTNDFDIFTMNVLEQFLQQFSGCLLVVSHDRYFMDKVADTLFVIEQDGSVSGFAGKCSEYLEYRAERQKEEERAKKESRRNAEKSAAQSATEGGSVQGAGGEQGAVEHGADIAKKRKRTFREQKEFESLEAEILTLEEEKSALELALSGGTNGDFSNIKENTARFTAVTELLTQKYTRWEELASLE